MALTAAAVTGSDGSVRSLESFGWGNSTARIGQYGTPLKANAIQDAREPTREPAQKRTRLGDINFAATAGMDRMRDFLNSQGITLHTEYWTPEMTDPNVKAYAIQTCENGANAICLMLVRKGEFAAYTSTAPQPFKSDKWMRVW